MNIDHTVSACSPAGIVLVSNLGIIERLNAQAETLLSISQNQAVGQSIIDVLDDQVPEAVLKDLIEKFRHTPTERADRRSIDPTNQLSLLQKSRFARDFLQREAKVEGAGGHFWHDEALTQTPQRPRNGCYPTPSDPATLECGPA